MFNGIQFAALLIASAVLIALHIRERHIMENISNWPAGKNPILTVMRENFDTGDKWGSNIGFLFGLCDIAIDYGIPVPAELEFRQAMGGSDIESYDYQAIAGLLKDEYYIHRALTLEEFKAHVSHALKVCQRYDALLRLAGEDY